MDNCFWWYLPQETTASIWYIMQCLKNLILTLLLNTSTISGNCAPNINWFDVAFMLSKMCWLIVIKIVTVKERISFSSTAIKCTCLNHILLTNYKISPTTQPLCVWKRNTSWSWNTVSDDHGPFFHLCEPSWWCLLMKTNNYLEHHVEVPGFK